MPKVLVKKLDAPRIGTGRLPAARATSDPGLEAFGGGAEKAKQSAAIRSIGVNVARIALREEKKANDIQVQDSEIDILNAKNDGEIAGASLKFEDAAGSLEKSLEVYDKKTEKILENSKNSNQKSRVIALINKNRASMSRLMEKHSAAELFKHENASTDVVIKLHKNNAAAHFSDDVSITEALLEQKKALIRKADRLGWSSEIEESEWRDIESSTHSAVIAAALSEGQTQRAKDYFEQNKEGILIEDSKAVSALIREEAANATHEEMANNVMIQVGNDFTKVQEALNKISDDKTRSEVAKKVNHQVQIAKGEQVKKITEIQKDDGYTLEDLELDKEILPPAWYKTKRVEMNDPGAWEENEKSFHKNFRVLMLEYAKVANSPPDKFADNMIEFQTKILTSKGKVDNDQYAQLKRITDNDFIAQNKEAISFWDPAFTVIRSFFGDAPVATALVINKIIEKTVDAKPEDRPKILQEEVDKQAVVNNPEIATLTDGQEVTRAGKKFTAIKQPDGTFKYARAK